MKRKETHADNLDFIVFSTHHRDREHGPGGGNRDDASDRRGHPHHRFFSGYAGGQGRNVGSLAAGMLRRSGEHGLDSIGTSVVERLYWRMDWSGYSTAVFTPRR